MADQLLPGDLILINSRRMRVITIEPYPDGIRLTLANDDLEMTADA